MQYKINKRKVTLTGFPLSSSNAMKDLPMLMSRDFLQMTPLSKQSMFSAATLNITSALLCRGEKKHIRKNAANAKPNLIFNGSHLKPSTCVVWLVCTKKTIL